MTQISVNYAKVLYELSVPGEVIQETADLFQTVVQLKEVLSSPVTPLKEKYHVIDLIFSKEIRSFLKEICDNQDIDQINEVFSAYHTYDCKMRGILEGTLYYVSIPEEAQLAGIKDYLMKRYQKNNVVLTLIQDTSLIGGFLLCVGETETDWSLKGRLNQLQRKLIGR